MTQTIQNDVNSVPLVEGRTTYVRVKVDFEAPSPLISHQQLKKHDVLRMAIAFVGNVAKPSYVQAQLGSPRTFDYMFVVPSAFVKHFDDAATAAANGTPLKQIGNAVKIWFPDTDHDLQVMLI